jgi:beta-lactamase class A
MNSWFRFTILAAVIFPFSAFHSSQAAEPLADKLLPLLTAHEGKVACAVKHLKTGEAFTHQADTPLPTASLIKLPIMVEAYRQADAGKVDLKKTITLTEADKAPGSGILSTHFSAGMTLPLQDAIHLMMVYSDNTATNLVLDQIGLPATNETMEQLKLPHTKIHSKVFRGSTSILPDRSKEFGLGSTTAAEMVQLLELLDQGQLASEKSTNAMRRHLAMCESKRLSKNLPPQVKVLQKTGSVNAVRTVAGIIETSSGNVAVCLLTNDNKDRRWTDENAGEVLSAKVGRIVYDHFHQAEIAEPKDDALQVGSIGARVEQLQEALNAQLKPSPQLTVDGDFGPQTRAAVIAWQKANELPTTGVIDQAAWKKLGLPPAEFQPAK